MEEVESRLKPLTEKISGLSHTMRSFYANGSGGPPGYLETARAEDTARFQRLFDLIERLDEQMDSVNTFITQQETKEDQREADRVKEAAALADTVKETERRFNRRMALIGLILGFLTFLFGMWNHHPQIGQILNGQASHQQTDAANPPH